MMGIKKLILDIDGKEHTISIEAAQKLYKALNELFGPKDSTIAYLPYRYWNQSPWIYLQGGNLQGGIQSNSTNNQNNGITLTMSKEA